MAYLPISRSFDRDSCRPHGCDLRVVHHFGRELPQPDVVVAVREHPELDGLPFHHVARLVGAWIPAEDVVIIVVRHPRYPNGRVNFEDDHIAAVIWKRHGCSLFLDESLLAGGITPGQGWPCTSVLPVGGHSARSLCSKDGPSTLLVEFSRPSPVHTRRRWHAHLIAGRSQKMCPHCGPNRAGRRLNFLNPFGYHNQGDYEPMALSGRERLQAAGLGTAAVAASTTP
jgi:hypothetical protein